ncbi:MAG: hypothetical protein FJ290_14920 [Planctomycetes bacterium]|nr:hypothetical protein [Planctomycetota bacterium]
MSKTVTVDEFARDAAGYISQAVHGGEHVLLKLGSDVVAELRPVRRERTLAELPALFDAMPRLSPEEVDSLEKDINEARERLNKLGVRDPWES